MEHTFQRPKKYEIVPRQWQESEAVSIPLAVTQSLLLNSTKMRKYQMHWRFFLHRPPFPLNCVSFCPSLYWPSLPSLLSFPSSQKTLLRAWYSKYIGFTQVSHWVYTLCHFKIIVQWERQKIIHFNFIALYKENLTQGRELLSTFINDEAEAQRGEVNCPISRL